MPRGCSAGIASEVSEPENPSPADRVLDLLVFAPAGLALTIVEELPNLVEKGRNRIEGRTATARVVGQFAVQMGCRELLRRARQLVDPDRPHHQATPTVTVRTDGSSQGDRSENRAPEVGRAARVSGPSDGPVRVAAAPRVEEQPEANQDLSPEAGVPEAEVAERAEVNGFGALGDLAIPAYDTLSASQVVKRLAGLSREELLEVGDHERQNRHRATILAKVEQLLSGDPSVGA
jgi:hypothetical protein